MHATDGSASPRRARRISYLASIGLAASGAATAQALHPFAPPVSSPTFGLVSTAGLVDVNRDGSTDVIVPGVFFGTLLTTLDENGEVLATNATGPWVASVPLPSAVVLAMAGGRLDQDALEDLVTVTSIGTINLHRNLGATRIDRCAFAPDELIDDFHVGYPVSPPFVHYSFPVARIGDFDQDGHNDVLIGGGPVDRWGGATRPGFVAFYKGNGTGRLQAMRYPLPGCVVDAEFADLDCNGTIDSLVVLTETGALGAFAYELVHLAVSAGALVPMGLPQTVGQARCTALEIADVMGDGNADYLLAQVQATGGNLYSHVYCHQGDGQGNASNSLWSWLWLPTNATFLGDFVSSLQVGDWNRDSHVDLAILRGFVQPPAIGSGGNAVYGSSEILVAMGPFLTTAPFEVIPLPGYQAFSSTYHPAFPQLPLVAEPDGLRPIDFGRDGSVDLLLPGLRTPGGSSSTTMVTLRNLTPPMPGDARFEKIGSPSGGAAGVPARLGFDGGRPAPGNANFACTIQNVQGGCLVGLMWGPWGAPNLMSAYGLEVHIAPSEVGFAAIASGSLPREGFHAYALPIPNSTAMIGDVGCFQYCYYDHVAGAFGGTQATGLWIGN